jgi:hypothetical protein
MTRPNPGFTKFKRCDDPRVLSQLENFWGNLQITSSASRFQPRKHILYLLNDAIGLELKMTKDHLDVGIWQFDDLKKPMFQFDVIMRTLLA